MCCAKGVRLCSSSIEPLLTFGALLDGHPVPRHIRLHAQSATGTAAVEVKPLLTFGALLEGHPVPKHITLIRLLQGWGVVVPVQSRRRWPWRLHILLQGSQAGVHLQQAGQRLAMLLQAPVREVATGLWPLMLQNTAQQLKAVDTSQSMAGVHLDVVQHGAATSRCTPAIAAQSTFHFAQSTFHFAAPQSRALYICPGL